MFDREHRVACVCGWHHLFGLGTLLWPFSHSNIQICDICGDAHYQISFNPGEKQNKTAKQNKTCTLCDNLGNGFFCQGTQHVVWGHLWEGWEKWRHSVEMRGGNNNQMGVRSGQRAKCAWRLPTHHFPSGTQWERWGVAGGRLIVFLLLCTLSTQSLRRLDVDLCRVFTQCPHCAAATLYRDNGSWIHGFTNQCSGADPDNSSGVLMIHRD